MSGGETWRAGHEVLYTKDTGADGVAYIRGEVHRITYNNGTGTRSSSTARLSADGNYIVFESESDVAGIGVADNDYHVLRYDVSTHTVTSLVPNQAAGEDSKYPSASGDGSKVCFYSPTDNGYAVDSRNVGSVKNQWWLTTADSQGNFGTPHMISWSAVSGRQAIATGRCTISEDGSTVVYSSNSPMLGGSKPSSGDYQVWETRDDGSSVNLLSGSIDLPNNTAGISTGSDCYDPAVSENGAFVAMRCKKKVHPNGYAPGSKASDEGWLFDRAENKLILFAPVTPTDDSKCGGTTANKAELLANLQALERLDGGRQRL